MNSKYKYGLVVGRFQPFHIGHKSVIDRALEECDKVVIAIGSAQEFGTKNNPLNYEERKSIIEMCYEEKEIEDRFIFIPLVNIGAGDSPIWGNYVMNSCIFKLGERPKIYYTGTETDRNHWLYNYIDVRTVIVNREDIKVSASEIRDRIREGREWKNLVPINKWYDGFTYYYYLLEEKVKHYDR